MPHSHKPPAVDSANPRALPLTSAYSSSPKCAAAKRTYPLAQRGLSFTTCLASCTASPNRLRLVRAAARLLKYTSLLQGAKVPGEGMKVKKDGVLLPLRIGGLTAQGHPTHPS